MSHVPSGRGDLVAKAKPTLVCLGEMKPGQSGDFFAQLSGRTRGARKDGKPFYTCRFSDPSRVAVAMIWFDGPWFEACDTQWKEGEFYKLRAAYAEHPTYGPQLEIANIRAVNDAD